MIEIGSSKPDMADALERTVLALKVIEVAGVNFVRIGNNLVNPNLIRWMKDGEQGEMLACIGELQFRHPLTGDSDCHAPD